MYVALFLLPIQMILILTICADNVDYNELKNLIKVNTTRDQGQAIAIPGQENTRLAKFEGEFYNELSNQHDRVDLFVKSKADEISRRLRRSTFNPSATHTDYLQNSFKRPFCDYWHDAHSAMASQCPKSDENDSRNMMGK